MVVDRLEAKLLRSVEPLAAADDDAASSAERSGAHRGKETHATRSDRDKKVAGVDAGSLHRVQRNRSGVAECGDVQAHRVRDAEDALDRVNDVGRIRPLRVVTVLTVAASFARA